MLPRTILNHGYLYALHDASSKTPNGSKRQRNVTKGLLFFVKGAVQTVKLTGYESYDPVVSWFWLPASLRADSDTNLEAYGRHIKLIQVAYQVMFFRNNDAFELAIQTSI